MPERTFEVTPVGVEYLCNICGEGTMEPTGVMYPTDPPKWPHICNRCGTTATLNNQYPTVRFERK